MKQTVAFTKEASNVFFHILTRCNLNCRHCYINYQQHGKKTLSIETIQKWLAEMAGRTKNANLIFLGGEPTLHPDLSVAVKAARKMGYASVTIDTNGYLFHHILEKVTPEEVDYFSFSLDGAEPETNDALRGKGTFEACTAGIRKAKAKAFKTSLIYTVSAANLRELQRMPELLEALKVDRFFIQVIGLRGKAGKKGAVCSPVTRTQWLEEIPRVARRAAATGVHAVYPKVYLDDADPFACAGLVADNYFIFPNGRVYRCPLCEDYPLHGFRFRDDRLAAAPPINETDLFQLSIPEGCVMNKLVQPETLTYTSGGSPAYRIACCLLKEEIPPA
ncbi:MAG: radical SAM protein [Deltaproteobacteria bacterium]|nr:radical SAM protein [Deltaproteobacteria bacterium]MBW1955538.1 radical SAM protein [Deltaproteobacteria bacterium]MBW2042480.1 radical SAM protein [Deltaproteobacteria bacterium]